MKIRWKKIGPKTLEGWIGKVRVFEIDERELKKVKYMQPTMVQSYDVYDEEEFENGNA